MARQQARRRHRERLTGIILAVLGVVVLVVAVIAIIEPKSHTTDAAGAPSTSASVSTSPSTVPSSTRPKPSPTAKSSSRPGPSLSLGSTSPTAGAKKLPLVVLNNTTTNGLATDAAQAFRNGGWTVSDIGNLQNEIISSCAYYDPSVDGAEAAAKALKAQFPGIQRVVEKFPELPSGPVVVVLTSDYSNG